MSEYQYYEFQAIDRPLSEADRQMLRKLSSRARITATSFANHYEWGDFRGDPRRLMESCFDFHLYLANWGTRRLMIRLPKRLVDRTRLDACLQQTDWVEVWTSDENVIVDICREEVARYGDGWEGESGRLAELAPLRADVLAGDLRVFYLLWLASVEEEAIDDDATEPLPGIGTLTPELEAFAEFFDIDPELVAAAAERRAGAGEGSGSRDAVRTVLDAMPEREKTELLLRLVDGDLHVVAELKRKAQALGAHPSAGLRTVGELRARWGAIREARERAEGQRVEAERRRREAEAEKARRGRLAALKQRGNGVWQDIEAEIERRNPSGYEAAAGLLFDLRELATEQATLIDFAQRLAAIRERHARKGKFIERLNGLT